MFLPPSVASLNLAAAKWSVIALLTLGLLLVTYQHGRHVVEGEKASAERDTAIAYAGEIIKHQTEAQRLAEENAALRAAQAPKDRLITKEITRYVTNPDRHCLLPGAFRLLHDGAATGQLIAVPGTGPLADGTADPVEDTAVLQTIDENYAACRDTAAKLEGWQRRQRSISRAAP